MNARRVPVHFALAFGVSLLAHAATLTLVRVPRAAYGSNPVDDVVVMIAVDSEQPEPPVEPPPPSPPEEITLGLDAPLPPSPTWMGFEEFQPQFAPKSEIEQAAFTDDPASAMFTPAPSSTPAPPPSPMAEAAAAAAQHVPDAAPEAGERIDSDADLAREEMDTPLAALLKRLVPKAEASQKPEDAARQAAQNATGTPANPAPPATAAPATSDESAVGAQADKQSPATSIIEVPRENWQIGKPLAGAGLELKPRRPTLTVLTTLTAAPRDPLCLIRFSRKGVPVLAKILKSSGDSRIDRAVESSLYRWRAAGKELEELSEDGTIDVEILLLMMR